MKKNMSIGLVLTLVFGVCIQFGFKSGVNASVESQAGEKITEEVLLQKDEAINEVVTYEEGLNPYFATSKATVLANLKVSDIQKIKDKGVVINITGEQENENLPQPVVVDGKTINVSIYSTDADMINAVEQAIR